MRDFSEEGARGRGKGRKEKIAGDGVRYVSGVAWIFWVQEEPLLTVTTLKVTEFARLS